jgi:hypothetical protein
MIDITSPHISCAAPIANILRCPLTSCARRALVVPSSCAVRSQRELSHVNFVGLSHPTHIDIASSWVLVVRSIRSCVVPYDLVLFPLNICMRSCRRRRPLHPTPSKLQARGFMWSDCAVPSKHVLSPPILCCPLLSCAVPSYLVLSPLNMRCTCFMSTSSTYVGLPHPTGGVNVSKLSTSQVVQSMRACAAPSHRSLSPLTDRCPLASGVSVASHVRERCHFQAPALTRQPPLRKSRRVWSGSPSRSRLRPWKPVPIYAHLPLPLSTCCVPSQPSHTRLKPSPEVLLDPASWRFRPSGANL